MLKLNALQKDPAAFAGRVSVCGWVRTVREGKAFGFIELTDGTVFKPVQIVYANDERNLGRNLTTGCAIAVSGELLTEDALRLFRYYGVSSVAVVRNKK